MLFLYHAHNKGCRQFRQRSNTLLWLREDEAGYQDVNASDAEGSEFAHDFRSIVSYTEKGTLIVCCRLILKSRHNVIISGKAQLISKRPIQRVRAGIGGGTPPAASTSRCLSRLDLLDSRCEVYLGGGPFCAFNTASSFS